MLAPRTILLVEDDRMLGEAVRDGLVQDGFDVDWATDGVNAAAMLQEHSYSAVLLDLGLPKASGLSVLKGMRARYDDTPVIIVTARDRIAERVEGLDAGADDYIIKPFDLDELAARIRATKRRAEGSVVAALRFGALALDVPKREVSLRGEPVKLSMQEFKILLALAQKPDRVHSRKDLEDAIYGWTHEVESNAIEVFIHQLRRKLGPEAVATVRGFGYRMGSA